MIPDQPFKGHVDKYQDYVDDLAQFMSEVVRPGSSGDIYMITHSMGGAVATAYLEQNPGAVKALVAASPMYEPALPLHIPQEIALGILESAIALGEGKNYAPGKGENDWNVPFEDNDVTTSEARYNYAHEDWIRHPELIIAGPTNQWVAEAIKIGMYDRDHAEALKQTRTLILQAGLDSVVDTDRTMSSHAVRTQRFYISRTRNTRFSWSKTKYGTRRSESCSISCAQYPFRARFSSTLSRVWLGLLVTFRTLVTTRLSSNSIA